MQNVPTVIDVISELQSVIKPSDPSYGDFQKLFNVFSQHEDNITDEVSYNILKRFLQSSNDENPYKQLSDIIKEEMEKLKEITQNNSEIKYDDINKTIKKTLMNTSAVALLNEEIETLKKSKIYSTFFGQNFNWHSNPLFYTKLEDSENLMQIIPQNIKNIWNNDSQRVNLNVNAQAFVPTRSNYRQNTQGSNLNQGKPSLGHQ